MLSFDFLVGLVLVVVALGVLAFIIKECFEFRIGDLKNAHRQLRRTIETHSPRDAKPVNDHLIGVIGEVTAHSGDSERPMRVRLRLESWPARLPAAAGDLAPVGSSVAVVAVDGPVLVVEATDDARA